MLNFDCGLMGRSKSTQSTKRFKAIYAQQHQKDEQTQEKRSNRQKFRSSNMVWWLCAATTSFERCLNKHVRVHAIKIKIFCNYCGKICVSVALNTI